MINLSPCIFKFISEKETVGKQKLNTHCRECVFSVAKSPSSIVGAKFFKIVSRWIGQLSLPLPHALWLCWPPTCLQYIPGDFLASCTQLRLLDSVKKSDITLCTFSTSQLFMQTQFSCSLKTWPHTETHYQGVLSATKFKRLMLLWNVYNKDHMRELRIQNRSERDLRSSEVT